MTEKEIIKELDQLPIIEFVKLLEEKERLRKLLESLKH